MHYSNSEGSMAIISASCNIVDVGSGVLASGQFREAVTPDPIVLLHLKAIGGQFGYTSFFAAQDAKNHILAVALAAINTQSSVTAWIDEPPGVAGGNLQCYSLQILTA